MKIKKEKKFNLKFSKTFHFFPHPKKNKVIDGREPLTTLKEAKTALFTHDSGECK